MSHSYSIVTFDETQTRYVITFFQTHFSYFFTYKLQSLLNVLIVYTNGHSV